MARILVVEDEANNVEILRRLLTRSGHDVVVAGSRDAAIEVMTDDPAELVLMDMGIPNSDEGLHNAAGGLEATCWIKSNEATRSVPIIAVSASAMLDERQRFLEAGCDDVQPKPFDFTTLLGAIDAQLNKAGG